MILGCPKIERYREPCAQSRTPVIDKFRAYVYRPYQMKLPHPKLAIPSLIIITAALTVGITLTLHTTNTAHPINKATSSTTKPTTSPAQLAADDAAYKASAALSTQLENTYNQAKQAEQAALDQYGDTSPQYQAAKSAADNAYEAYGNQLNDTMKKSLQVTIDGGTPSN
jgi:hypothetical protein